MAFKSVKQYNEEKYGGKFILQNDQDSADVIFLYQSVNDMLVADVHYIKSPGYNGYVHCNGRGCPACGKGIRVQTKLFIPLYNITAGEIQFWDRTTKFEPQFYSDVFSKFPNPSEYVFKVTRNGASGDINTRYAIQVLASNNVKSYADILLENKINFPEYYENICKNADAAILSTWLNASQNSSSGDIPEYVPMPRVTPSNTSSVISEISDSSVLSDDEFSDELDCVPF